MTLPTTELRNPQSEQLDQLSALQIVELMNAEDAKIPAAVAAEAPAIARAMEAVADSFRRGGRLIYLGAGTSGRLGVLDASECPPTFNTPPEQVVGLIAGGPTALTTAVEGAEDHGELAVADLDELQVNEKDVVVGIATSGGTPYVLQGLAYAKQRGALTIGFSCSAGSPVSQAADLAITPVVGPEVVSGSTRLKAGTATKLVLNMLTTGAMVLVGKTYGNLMVDLRATNKKLKARTARIVSYLTSLDEEASRALLDRCAGELKTSIVVHLCSVSPESARELLCQAQGHLRSALEAGVARSGMVQKSRELNAASEATSTLLLGIDAGGTQTTALLARQETTGEQTILGRGQAGPANPHAVGFDKALQALDASISAAFADALIQRSIVAAACIAVAGAGRQEDRQKIEAWAEQAQVAQRLLQVHDARPILAAASPSKADIALIAGTGSLAYGEDASGRNVRSGGWGYLLGDEGSAYALAIAGLQAVVRARDGRGPVTALTERLHNALGVTTVDELVPSVYGRDRAAIASLAPAVVACATDGDEVALAIVRKAAAELAQMVVRVAMQLELRQDTYLLAVAGGVLTSAEIMRQELVREVRAKGFAPRDVQVILEPAIGSVRLAAELILQAKS